MGAVVLAAGGSSRMAGANKLIEPVDGVAMVALVVDAALAAGAAPVVVVTGPEAGAIEGALGGRSVERVANPRWREGMSTSLAAGLAALEGRVEGALICLGDMPRVTPDDLASLLQAFREGAGGASGPPGPGAAGRGEALPGEGPAAFVPVHGGRRGNPVLWAAPWFGALRALEGDRGARALLGELAGRVVEVPAGAGVLLDVDTPDALARLRRVPDGAGRHRPAVTDRSASGRKGES